MEPLAFVEIVDRHDDVLARHPVYRWPARIGRGYAADVILDDPYVAPLHVSIEPVEGERFTVSDRDSMNGIVSASGERVAAVEVGPEDLFRIGHTQIRIRVPSYAVAQERPMRAVALYRRPAAFALMATLTISLFLWYAWIVTSDDHDRFDIVFPTLAMSAVVAVWIGVWSFVSSAVGRRPNFAAHGFVACAGVIAVTVVDSFFEYLSFGFDAEWLGYVGGIATAVVVAYMVYRHLLLNSRAKRRNLVLAASTISIVLCGGIAALEFGLERSQDGSQRYSGIIKAPVFLAVQGTTPEAFLSEAEALKPKVDAMRRAK